MAQTVNKVNDFVETLKKDTEKLVKEQFPGKILEIEELFKQVKELSTSEHVHVDIPYPEPLVDNNGTDEPSNKKRKAEELNTNNHGNSVPGTRVLVFPGGTIPYNKIIHKYCEKTKPWMKELIEHSNMVRMWINFLIPKIEDGNNFGVSIQEDVLNEARQVESEASTYLDQISRYYLQRARIITKISKYPHIEDYRQSIRELDEKQIVSLQSAVLEMRNHYASLHDMIMKNIDKIKVPRSINQHNMY